MFTAGKNTLSEVIVTNAGTSLRNARVGVAAPLATGGRAVLRVSLVVPLAAQRSALAADLGTLAAAVPVDDRALRPGLWALTVDGRWRWRWARRWLAIDAAAELRGAGATSPGGRLPLRAALGGGVVAFGHLELGATLHTAAALLASAPSGEAFVHALSLDAALPLDASFAILEANADPSPCRTDCTLPRCGDGIVDPGETCDDGNFTSGDGCSSDCTAFD